MFSFGREIRGGVLADADHDEVISYRYVAIGGLRDRRSECRKTCLGPFQDSRYGIRITGREKGQLTINDGQSAKKRVLGCTDADAEVGGVDRCAPVPACVLEQKGFE